MRIETTISIGEREAAPEPGDTLLLAIGEATTVETKVIAVERVADGLRLTLDVPDMRVFAWGEALRRYAGMRGAYVHSAGTRATVRPVRGSVRMWTGTRPPKDQRP